MAGNDFRTFLDAVSKDPALQAALNKTASAEDFAATAVSLGSGLGLHFSTSDVLTVMSTQASQAAQSDVLSDEQLDTVAGGNCGVTCVVTRDSAVQTIGCSYNLKLSWKV